MGSFQFGRRIVWPVTNGIIDIPEEDWLRGGTPDERRIVPWGIQSNDDDDIDFWQGRLADDLVDTATTALVDELR